MLPLIQNFIISIVETRLLQKRLQDLNKWRDYLFCLGYGFLVLFVIVQYFYLKKYFLTSSCFLLIASGIYLYAYIFFHGERAPLRFQLIVMLFVIAIHITDRIKRIKQETKCFLSGSKAFNSSFFVFICSGILGSLFFIYIFGTAILDFTYTDWLMPGGDLSLHYLGWRFFRNSSWYFPFGLMDNIVHPFKISIIYTDSIPLFAVIFKLLSPILPENFQYFGLFGIICYALQGGIGALVIRKIGCDSGFSIIGSLFFTLSTVMMYRIYGHTALAAHFIILLCILVSLEKNHSHKRQILLWSGLFALSAAIHLYFVPMVMIFMFFYLLREYFSSKKIINQCIVLGVSLLVLIGTMFCLGAFYFIKDPSMGGLGYFSANLNTFTNPQGSSRFIKDMSVATDGQYEGYAYLGLGMISFIMFIIFYEIGRMNKLKTVTISETKLFPYILGIVLVFLLFALSPTITFYRYKLFAYHVIWPFERLWGIFRATGRMTWVIIYIIVTICLWWLCTQFSRKKAIILLSVYLLIQWADLKPWFVNKGDGFKTRVTWQTKLSSPAWDNLANDYQHIFFLGNPLIVNGHFTIENSFYFLDLAANNKMTVNDAYLARTNSDKIHKNKQNEMAYLTNNEPRDDTIYIFQDEEQASLFSEAGKGVCFFRIDDEFIGINSKKTYLDNYEF
jgi:hypothetical protein